MDLRGTLRKAAGLLVELPPEEETESSERAESEGVSIASVNTGVNSTDKMWAELEQEAKQKSGVTSAALAIPMPQRAPESGSSNASPRTVEQIVRDSHGPNLDQIQVSPETVSLAESRPDGGVDFARIYTSANLPTVTFTSEQVLEMLSALPAGLSLDNKRQMMMVSINAMGKAIGASPETIVADASRKLAALASYTEGLAKLTGDYTAASEQKIATLQAEIEKIRLQMSEAQERQTRETLACTTESHRLDELLEFFSLDVPPSKHAG